MGMLLLAQLNACKPVIFSSKPLTMSLPRLGGALPSTFNSCLALDGKEHGLQRRRRISAAVEIATCVRQTCLSLDAASREMSARIKEIDRVIQRVDHLAKACTSSKQPQTKTGTPSDPVRSGDISATSTVTVVPTHIDTGRDADDKQAMGGHSTSPHNATLPCIIADIQENRSAHVKTTVIENSAQGMVEEVLPAEVVGERPIMQQIGTSSHSLHPGIDGSSSVKISLYKQQRTAVVTVQVAVQVHPCLQLPDTQDDAECLLPCGREPHMDVAVAFAASAAAQAANDCSRYAPLCTSHRMHSYDCVTVHTSLTGALNCETLTHASRLDTWPHGLSSGASIMLML